MPVNAGPEYFAAERKYSQAKTTKDKIKALEEMIKTAPKHKSSEKMLGDLRRRLARLKKELKKEQAAKSKVKPRFSLKKDGAAQVCIIGMTNSGKSSLLKLLTGANVEIADYEYTTTEPAVGMMDYTGVKIQVVEIPSTFSSDVVSIVRICDLVLILLDGRRDREKELDCLIGVLESNRIVDKPLLIIYNRRDGASNEQALEISTATGENIEKLKDEIWRRLNLIRIYTKSPNRPKTDVPLTLKKGSTVKDATERVHKLMIRNFKFARIFNNTRRSGLKVGLDYTLSDLDVVEIHSG